MKISIFLILWILVMGCSSSHFSYQTVYPPDQFYRHLLVLYIDGTLNLHQLDEETYQLELSGRYNNLIDIEYRRHIEKALARNLKSSLTRVTNGSTLYPLNELVPFRDFMDTLMHQGIDAILLVNLNDYRYKSYSSYDSSTDTYYENIQPNAFFLFYLIEVDTRKPVCLGVSRIMGHFAGYDTLNNKFARGLATRLHKEQYIYLTEHF